MSIKAMLTAAAATLLLAIPATADAKPARSQGNPKQTTSTVYSRYCKAQSRRHVKGGRQTPFIRCLTAMGKAADGASPRAACKGLSKKHGAGTKGTPFSRCVVAASDLKDDRASERDSADDAPDADAAPDESSDDQDLVTDDDSSFDDGGDDSWTGPDDVTEKDDEPV